MVVYWGVAIEILHIDRTDPAGFPMFNDLAADIWRCFRDDPRVDVDLAASDNGSNMLIATTRIPLKGRTLQTIHKIVERHMMGDDIRIGSD